MLKKIAILTDSTCDIPQSLIEQFSILIQHHVVIWGNRQYRDRVDLQPEEFYQRLGKESTFPTTSQASVIDFSTRFQEAYEQGVDEVVAILLNEKFSGAIQCATEAAKTAPLPVHIHNSRGVTMSLGWQVLAAAKVRELGGGVAEMIAAAERVRQRVQLFIGLDTLDYVHRGGRIGNASRLFGTMLNIKPMIYVDHEKGTVEAGGMAMTRRKMIDMLYNKFFSLMHPGPLHIAVLHGDAPRDAAALAERVQQERHPAELLTNITCPVLGIHTGPQTIALCGYGGE